MSLMMVMVGVTEMAAAVVDAEAEVAAEAAAEVAVDVDTTMAAGVTSEDAMATTIGMVEIMDVEEETPTTAENPATDSTTPGITIGPGTTPTRQEEERTTAAAEVTHTIVTTPETEEDIRTEEVTSTGLRPPETTTPLIITVAAVAVEIPTIATSLPVTGTTTEVEAATTVPRLLVTRRSSARGAAREIAAVVETMERTLRRPDTRHRESSLSHCDCLLVMTYWIH